MGLSSSSQTKDERNVKSAHHCPSTLILGWWSCIFSPPPPPPLCSHTTTPPFTPPPGLHLARVQALHVPLLPVVVGPQDPVRRAGRAELENPRNHHTRTDAYHIWYIPLLGKPPHLWTAGNARIGVCLTDAHPTTWTTCWAGGINETT